MADLEQTGSTVGTLSEWAGPYITDMLGRAEALSKLPYQSYEGALTAGPSALQTKAFEGIGSLTVPTGVTQAGQMMGDIAKKAGTMSYTPTTFTNPYATPEDYATGQFTNQYKAPDPYQSGIFNALQFDQQGVQKYMNPYLQSVLNPQLREAQRKADLARTAMQTRMAQAGGYGGSRQAIMEAAMERDLLQQMGDITGTGYAKAYEDAAKRLEEQNARNLAAAEFGEKSRQFGYGKSMDAADLAAKYGLDVEKAREASRQFGYGKKMEAAETAAKYGLDTQREQEAAKQYAAKYGLDALTKQLEATRGMADIGVKESDINRANLEAMLKAGATQRDIEQAGLTADLARWEKEQAYPYEQLKFLREMIAGIPGISSSAAYGQAPSELSSAAGGAATLLKLLELLKPSK